MFDALISFTYNAGIGNFKTSTMFELIKKRDFVAAAAEFPKWKFSKGKVTAGLIARRKDERALFERDPYA